MSNYSLLDSNIYHEEYEVCKQLGKGAFGIVFQIKDRRDQICYAAKHMKIVQQEQKQQVMKEIKLLNKLNHQQIIKFIGAFETEKKSEVILVTEYLDGGELFERIVSDDFKLTESDACEFMKQILLGVEYLHKNNVVHLDLKPENIICANRSSMDIKIIDFGLAQKVFPGVQFRTFCGSPEYIAPEMVSYEDITPATDMWSLGVICYTLLAGFSPFAGKTNDETYENIVKVNYSMELPEFRIISQNAKDFITALLQKCSKDRLSAKQSLAENWLVQPIRPSVIKYIDTKNLKKFLTNRRLKKCYNAILAVNKISHRIVIKTKMPQRTVIKSISDPTTFGEFKKVKYNDLTLDKKLQSED